MLLLSSLAGQTPSAALPPHCLYTWSPVDQLRGEPPGQTANGGGKAETEKKKKNRGKNMQYILFCCYKKYYSNLRSTLTVLNESLWGSEGWRTHLQSGKDQFHLSQFELPQQVPELADQRVIYDADMVTIQDHWPRRRHWRRDVRGESKWEENLKEERRLNKTDITTHYC